MIERFDTLISVLSGPTEPDSPMSAEHRPVPPSCPSLQPSTPPSQQDMPRDNDDDDDVDDDTLFRLRSGSTSEKNFAVKLVRHFFLPHELDGRNVRGVVDKLPLDPEKIGKIRAIIFKFFPSSLAQQELLWRECRKAIDAYLHNRKISEARAT